MTLFEQLPGRDRDLPVLRFGNVARMPEEDVRIKLAEDWPVDVPAYLAEARSWGGESGAPAFLYFPMDRAAEGLGKGTILIGQSELPSSIGNVRGLLGMVHGHYDITRVVQGGTISAMIPTVDMNAGIAIVIPAWTILETLELEELVEGREKIEKEAED